MVHVELECRQRQFCLGCFDCFVVPEVIAPVHLHGVYLLLQRVGKDLRLHYTEIEVIN